MPGGNKVLAAERLLLARMLESLGRPPLRIALWDGQEIGDQGAASAARLVIGDRGALLRLVADPEYWFGRMYTAGRIAVEGDLPQLIETVYRSLLRVRSRPPWQKLLAPLLNGRRNSVADARSNIHHHYDIGNDFYRLWLDRELVYTCAYFPDPAMGLDEAQSAKLDYVCRKLQLKPGDTVVEAGCGWGALALHMARRYGAHVKAYNISREQIGLARQRAGELGLDGQVEFIEDDYRSIRGEFDVFVSVGMLEHVGIEHYRELGAVIDHSLKRHGRGLIHSIGRDYPMAINPWIERHIFPGGCPPSLSQMMDVFEPSGLSVLDVENLRLHYARTLEHWLRRFDAAADRVTGMFDAEFVRSWRLYLAGSLAAFRSGDMQLFQVTFARSGDNGIPWTRQHLYAP